MNTQNCRSNNDFEIIFNNIRTPWFLIKTDKIAPVI